MPQRAAPVLDAFGQSGHTDQTTTARCSPYFGERIQAPWAPGWKTYHAMCRVFVEACRS